MQGYHTWWGARGDDFEIVTQIASAAAWRRLYGRLDLYADEKSALEILRLDLKWIYRHVHFLPERKDVSTLACWAWPKIEAMRLAGQKDEVTCSVDLDCVVWEPLYISTRVAIYGLHYDDGTWPAYHSFRPLLKWIAPRINFDVQPINAALLLMADENVRREYIAVADKAISFISRFALDPKRICKDTGAISIEQLCPAAVALSSGKRVDVFENITNLDQWRHDPARIMHLWGSKRIYRSNPKARAALMEHLIERVKEFDPRAAGAMECVRSGLGH